MFFVLLYITRPQGITSTIAIAIGLRVVYKGDKKIKVGIEENEVFLFEGQGGRPGGRPGGRGGPANTFVFFRGSGPSCVHIMQTIATPMILGPCLCTLDQIRQVGERYTWRSSAESMSLIYGIVQIQ